MSPSPSLRAQGRAFESEGVTVLGSHLLQQFFQAFISRWLGFDMHDVLPWVVGVILPGLDSHG
jgi:hypothetical protein